MYLSNLTQREKEMFLDLAYALSSADGSITEKEKIVIDCYLAEMEYPDYVPEIKDKADIIENLAEHSNMQNKKIFIFELIGLAMCDDSYDDCEKEFIFNAACKFGLPSDFIHSCEKMITEYLTIQSNISSLILG